MDELSNRVSYSYHAGSPERFDESKKLLQNCSWQEDWKGQKASLTTWHSDFRRKLLSPPQRESDDGTFAIGKQEKAKRTATTELCKSVEEAFTKALRNASHAR